MGVPGFTARKGEAMLQTRRALVRARVPKARDAEYMRALIATGALVLWPWSLILIHLLGG